MTFLPTEVVEIIRMFYSYWILIRSHVGGVEAEVVKIWYIPSAGKCSPTVIDKSQPIESMRSRLRDGKYEVIEGVDFLIQLLYTHNL